MNIFNSLPHIQYFSAIVGILSFIMFYFIIGKKLYLIFKNLFISLRAEIRPETSKPLRPLTEDEILILTDYLNKEEKYNKIIWIVLSILISLPTMVIFVYAISNTPFFAFFKSDLGAIFGWLLIVALISMFYFIFIKIDKNKRLDLKSPVHIVTSILSEAPLIETKKAVTVGRYAFQQNAMLNSCRESLLAMNAGERITAEFSPRSCYLWNIKKT